MASFKKWFRCTYRDPITDTPCQMSSDRQWNVDRHYKKVYLSQTRRRPQHWGFHDMSDNHRSRSPSASDLDPPDLHAGDAALNARPALSTATQSPRRQSLLSPGGIEAPKDMGLLSCPSDRTLDAADHDSEPGVLCIPPPPFEQNPWLGRFAQRDPILVYDVKRSTKRPGEQLGLDWLTIFGKLAFEAALA
ncbi:hypothetical protein MMC17_009741 [Xylographa soralifera]|nr:hypothetical protein [Xylographa soralifera]